MSVGVRDEIRRNIFPFGVKYCFACFRNFRVISSPCFPPVVASWEDFGSRGSSGRYGALKVIRSNLDGIFWKRLDWIVWNFSFWRAFIALGFMSEARMFFGGRNFSAVFERVPVPVPKSR